MNPPSNLQREIRIQFVQNFIVLLIFKTTQTGICSLDIKYICWYNVIGTPLPKKKKKKKWHYTVGIYHPSN